eukprot:gene23640-9843_t
MIQRDRMPIQDKINALTSSREDDEVMYIQYVSTLASADLFSIDEEVSRRRGLFEKVEARIFAAQQSGNASENRLAELQYERKQLKELLDAVMSKVEGGEAALAQAIVGLEETLQRAKEEEHQLKMDIQ